MVPNNATDLMAFDLLYLSFARPVLECLMSLVCLIIVTPNFTSVSVMVASEVNVL